MGIELEAVSHRYQELESLKKISLSVSEHSRVGIVGASGCGKTTLLEIVSGLREAETGSCTVNGARDLQTRLAQCALMPQKDLLLPWRSALDNACLGLENRGLSRKVARDHAAPLFQRLGLADFELRTPAELSGGMRQRVAFLRTLLVEKDVLLLDEPFGALDSITRAEMQQWLLDVLDEQPRTVLLVTHDVEEAIFLCDRVVVLSPRPGRVIESLAIDLADRRDRNEVVTSSEFAVLKERALEALER